MRRPPFLAPLLALSLSTSSAFAQPAASSSLGTAREMLAQGRFGEAEKYAKQAIATGGAQKLVATALQGEIFAAQGKVDEAIRLLEPQKTAQGVGGRRVRLLLGELLVRAGRRADAEPVLME